MVKILILSLVICCPFLGFGSDDQSPKVVNVGNNQIYKYYYGEQSLKIEKCMTLASQACQSLYEEKLERPYGLIEDLVKEGKGLWSEDLGTTGATSLAAQIAAVGAGGGISMLLQGAGASGVVTGVAVSSLMGATFALMAPVIALAPTALSVFGRFLYNVKYRDLNDEEKIAILTTIVDPELGAKLYEPEAYSEMLEIAIESFDRYED